MGGEKCFLVGLGTLGRGSPPHGRGKAIIYNFYMAFDRITPAWAGKRELSAVILPPCEDHPRMGGEKPLAGP